MQQKSTFDKTFFVPSVNSREKFKLKTKLFSSQIWDALLPYSHLTSRLADRHLVAETGGDHE